MDLRQQLLLQHPKVSCYWTELCVSFQSTICINHVIVVCMCVIMDDVYQFKLVDSPPKAHSMNNEWGSNIYLIFVLFSLSYIYPSKISPPTQLAYN